MKGAHQGLGETGLRSGSPLSFPSVSRNTFPWPFVRETQRCPQNANNTDTFSPITDTTKNQHNFGIAGPESFLNSSLVWNTTMKRIVLS